MSRPSDGTGDVKLSASIMVVAVILLFAAFLFLFFVYLRAKHYWGACPPLRRARARLVFAAEQIGFPRRGLDPALIQALPSLVFYAKDLKVGIECAVCLNELSDGEAARMLPKCSHGFHLDCIDMWLHSNSTCPLCRSPVVAEPLPDTMPLGVLHPEMVVVRDGHPLNSLNEVQQGSSSSGESSSASLDAGMSVTEIPSNSPLPSASLVVLEEVIIA